MSPNATLYLNCMVVDDESMGRKLMEENISKIPYLKHIISCKNAFEALEALKNNNIDLLFLDIQMPGMIGTEFLNTLPEKPMTIFVTAYPQYALEGYELEVIDYLMKPVSLERFTKAVNKAYERKRLNQNAKNIPKNQNTGDDSIFVNVEYSLVKLKKEEILYVEGMKDYVKIHLTQGKKRVITKASLSSMEEKLGEDNFMRVHKSYIVAIDKVQAIRNQVLQVEDHEVPVSTQKVEEVLARIGYVK